MGSRVSPAGQGSGGSLCPGRPDYDRSLSEEQPSPPHSADSSNPFETRIRVDTLRPIFVIGPARSGTSAVTRMINLLGSPLCRDEDLYIGDHNPLGYWESVTVCRISDEVLAGLGGSWGLPPEPRDLAGFGELRGRESAAAAAFSRAHPLPGWVCKDPRLCVTLPFWTAALSADPAIVLVARSPEMVAPSMVRMGFREAHSLAFWERYTLWALHNLQGRAVASLRYETLVASPERECLLLAKSLRQAGCSAVDLSRAQAAAESITAVRSAPPSCSSLTTAHRDLWALLQELPPWSPEFAVTVPPESAATTELLEAIRGEEWLDSALRRSRTVLDNPVKLIGRGLRLLPPLRWVPQDRLHKLRRWPRASRGGE